MGAAIHPIRTMSATVMRAVEHLVVGFPGYQFKGEIAPALIDLTERGAIRGIDLLFVEKDTDGAILKFELRHLPPAHAARFEQLDSGIDDLLNSEDARKLAAALPPDSTAIRNLRARW